MMFDALLVNAAGWQTSVRPISAALRGWSSLAYPSADRKWTQRRPRYRSGSRGRTARPVLGGLTPSSKVKLIGQSALEQPRRGDMV